MARFAVTTHVVATCWSLRLDGLLAQVRRAHEVLGATCVPGTTPTHLVEARLDLLAHPPEPGDIERLVAVAEGRLLVTCRPGGSGSPPGRDERHRLLSLALAAGAAACDVEHDGGSLPERHGRSLILSHHWPLDGPEPAAIDVRDRLQAMADLGPDVVKVAAPVASAAGALAWLDRGDAIPPRMGWAPVPLGHAGAWTRPLARRLGLALAYFSADEFLPGGDFGQISLADALGPFAVQDVSARTRIFAVFGWPLRETWSPRLHSELFRRRGIDARLMPLPVRDIDEARSLMGALDVEGAAVTMPHKEGIRSLAGSESAHVARSGVANTLRRRGDRLEAESFDGVAVADLLAEALDLRDARVLVMGAGGAARAAAAELVDAGARVTIVARRGSQAAEAASRTGAAAASLDALAGLPRDVLVNATPVGSTGSPSFVADEGALDAAVVLDMVTTPAQTPLVALARSRGRVVIDGLAMLARQAAAQQSFWLDGSGVMPPTPAEALSVLRNLAATHG